MFDPFLALSIRVAEAIRAQRAPGQGLVEYSVIIVTIAVAVIAIVSTLGQTIKTNWWDVIVAAFP